MKKASVAIVLALILVFGTSQRAFSGGDKKNHAALFLGVTQGLESGAKTYFSLGVDEEYRLDEMWGVGGLAELVFATGYTQTIIGVPVFAHFGDAKVLAAPAYEFYTLAGESKAYFLFRIGGGYDFHANSISITPGVNLDFVNGKTLLVAGVSFGIGF
jgi:hypothetical protein